MPVIWGTVADPGGKTFVTYSYDVVGPRRAFMCSNLDGLQLRNARV